MNAPWFELRNATRWRPFLSRAAACLALASMLLPVVVASPDPAVSMVRDIDLSGGEDPEPESPAEAPGADAPEAVIVAHRLRGRGPRDEMRCPPIVLSALPAPGCRGALRIAGAPDDRQPGFDGGSRLPLLC